MKLITDVEGYIKAPDLYNELAKLHKKASITIYKAAQREGLFACKHYSLNRGRLEYWFNKREVESIKQKVATHYSKRKP